MQSYATWLIVFILIFSVPAATAFAGQLSLGTWMASGSQQWHISFPMHNSPEIFGSTEPPQTGASKLFYLQKGTYLTASYVNAISPRRQLIIDGVFSGKLNQATGSGAD